MMLDMVSFGNPTALVLEGSSDLSHWRSFSFSSQSVNAASGDPRKLRLIVDELLSPDETRHFFRTRPSINPLFQAADPDSIIIGDELWIFPTYRAGQGRVYAHSTKDLMRWTLQGPVFQFAGVPWIPAGKAAWAPSVTAKNGKFYLYYSVGPKPASIGVAVSNSPAGPYVDSGKALLQDNGISSFEAIDPMVYTDAETNISYLYAGGSSGSTLRIYQLTDDMINLAGQMTAATPNLFTEGAFVHKRGSTFYLSYSHGNWQNDTYSVHYSTSATPLGPWSYQGKILGSSTKHKGPGHHSIVQRPSTDEWFIIYHRWNSAVGSGPYSGSRSVAVERLFHTPQNTLEVVTMTDAGLGPVTFGP
jgi:beta-xylosidase